MAAARVPVGDTFESIGYRPVNMTDPTAANLFRVLGMIEPGQCTIVADEAEKIDKSPEIMSTQKTGYHIRGKVARTNSNTWKQEFFYTYCLKMIIAERSPSQATAKGVLDRTFMFNTYKGEPKHDIKEVLNPAGDTIRQKLLNELMDFRKLMLIYRLMHFKDPIADIDIGVNGRDKELAKPVMQLFYNTKAQDEIQSALQKFIDIKNQRKENTIEATLYSIIANVISTKGREVSVADLWNTIKGTVEGTSNENKPNEYHTADYGIIYRNTITNIICDKFGAKRKHRETGNVLVFDPEKVARAGRVYNSKISIQTKIVQQEEEGKDNHNPESPEGSEGSTAKDSNSTDSVPTENSGITTNSSEKLFQNEQNGTRVDTDFTQEKRDNMTAYPTKPSEPSGPSASVEPTSIVSVERFFHDVADLPYQPLPEHIARAKPLLPYHW